MGRWTRGVVSEIEFTPPPTFLRFKVHLLNHLNYPGPPSPLYYGLRGEICKHALFEILVIDLRFSY